jgi:hypothetical protein
MPKLTYWTLVTLLGAGFATRVAAQPVMFAEPLSPRLANYRIAVRLNDTTRQLHGIEELNWKNASADTITELRFHLYLNAFRNTLSTFMKEGETLRGLTLPDNSWGWIDIQSMETLGGEDLTPGLDFLHPDDDNANDRTVLRALLHHPVVPKGSITLRIEFTAQLPRIFARTGFVRDFFMVGQWFPKIGVYESSRRRTVTHGAWNCHQFHANSEFFADFGVYDVAITIPDRYVVGATGVQIAEMRHDDGTKTLSFHAEDVHDFAWTASPHFADLAETWRGVSIRVLMQPQRLAEAGRYFEAVTAALEFFSSHLGPYPYPTLTIVDPAYGGLGAGGMEYPTLITSSSFWELPRGIRLPEAVTIHEFGHQYWYGMCATNEFEEAWMDEGINQYYECRIMDATYGRGTSLLNWLGLQIGDLEYSRASYTGMPDPGLAPPATLAWKFPAGSYGVLTYDKTATILATAERMVGTAVLDSAMKTFFRRWRFRHPNGHDFVKTFDELSVRIPGSRAGRTLSSFFNQTIFGTATCDFEVSHLHSEEIRPPRGILDSAGLSASTTMLREQGIPYRSSVTVVRHGDLQVPVDMEIGFDNGEKLRESWDSDERVKEFVYVRPARLTWANVDPDRKILLDTNLNNNGRTLTPPRTSLRRFTAKALFWIQNVIETVASLI